MILIDSNIFMYAAGAEHPHKEPSRSFLEEVARGDVEAALDAEVLHRGQERPRQPQARSGDNDQYSSMACPAASGAAAVSWDLAHSSSLAVERAD